MTRQGQSSWEVIFYETPQGVRLAEEWLKEQGPKVGARFGRVFELEQEKVQRRLLHFTALGRKFVMLHGFVKKAQKAPPKEIEVAEQRMKDYMNRWERAQRKGR
jgi:phage-related protein